MRTVNENAVSPVVGVMLMLVVVIIIAAIVSGFAGSLAQTNNKAPQATIKGTLYVNGSGPNLVVLTHMGGDELATTKTTILIKKGDDWGTYFGVFSGGSSLVDKSKVHDSSSPPKYWFNATAGGTVDVNVWTAGQTMFSDFSGFSSTDIGKTLNLEVQTTDGKLISKSKMAIVP